MRARTSSDILIWDIFVRIAHWTLASAFFIAYLTEDAREVHISAGYAVGVLIVSRVVWGFVGTRHARFADFVTGPVTASNYLWDLTHGRAKRYVGHSPAGGIMIIALFVSLTAAVSTRLIGYAEEGGGPLASFYGERLSAKTTTSTDPEQEGEDRRGKTIARQSHEVIANVSLGLVVFHIFGVILASYMHQENLTGAMITGRKRDLAEAPTTKLQSSHSAK